MLDKIFFDHPADVGESYGEHLRHAGGFGLRMVGGGVACLLHALVPALFVTKASDTVAALNRDLVRKRGAVRDATIEARTGGWVI